MFIIKHQINSTYPDVWRLTTNLYNLVNIRALVGKFTKMLRSDAKLDCDNLTTDYGGYSACITV